MVRRKGGGSSINILEKRGSNFNYSEERRYTLVTLCNGAECLFGVSSVVSALYHSYTRVNVHVCVHRETWMAASEFLRREKPRKKSREHVPMGHVGVPRMVPRVVPRVVSDRPSRRAVDHDTDYTYTECVPNTN